MLIRKLDAHLSLKKQAGATFIGMLFVGVAVVFLAVMAIKIFPAYQEYFSVKTVIKALNNESLSTMNKKEIQDSFDRRANTGYVTVINGHDLTINKNDDGKTVVSVQYQVIKPLFGNVSVLIDFETSVNGE
jgi:hypothetical protein